MPSQSDFEVNGFTGAALHHQPSFASQASTVKPERNEDEAPRNGARHQEILGASLEGQITLQETRAEEHNDPTEDLPSKDWEELEARYELDMEAAIQHEQSIMDEIEWVMKACYC
jgi:hypothetical protein